MAKSFGLSNEDANEIVQQMYLRIDGYVSDPSKILYNKKEVNTFYVYVTLRNLYLSNSHKLNKKFIYLDDVPNVFNIEDMEFSPKQKELFDDVIDMINEMVDDWYWYDKRMFNMHFYDEMSMRKIAKETKISLSSIFNTLSNGKAKVKEGVLEKYREYLKSKV